MSNSKHKNRKAKDNHENLRIPLENTENHETHKIQLENNAKH